MQALLQCKPARFSIVNLLNTILKLKHLSQHVESLIFSSEQPISPAEIKSVLDNAHNKGKKAKDKIKVKAIVKAVDALKERYTAEEFSFEIVEIDGGYQFLSKPAYFDSVAAYLQYTTKKRLSKAALETLSIIAYKQPVTKIEAEKIRGVSCDYSIQKLLEKELIEISGRSESPGRPLLYATSGKFMDYFGLKNINELPKLKDFNSGENTIGEAAPIEETMSLPENGTIEEIPGSESPENVVDDNEIKPSMDSGDNVVEGEAKNIEIVEHINPEEFVEGDGLVINEIIEEIPAATENKVDEIIVEDNRENEIQPNAPIIDDEFEIISNQRPSEEE